MIRSKISLLGAAALLASVAVPAQAAPIFAPVPVANYITVGGLDWAWAAPCAAYGSSCGVVDMSYQATQGWHFPSLAEFLARPTVGDFGGKCASAWFSTAHSHCDFGDPTYGGGVNGAGQPMGYLFDYGYGITTNGTSGVAETWVVRGELENGAVPEPSTWAMMLAGFGAVGFAMRRRHQKVAVSFA